MSDPANEILCDTCGWTVGMACPECPGCGCYNSSCSGWRHRDDEMDDDPAEHEATCPECGGTYDDRYGPSQYECDCV